MTELDDYYLDILRSSANYSLGEAGRLLNPDKVIVSKPLEIGPNDVILGFKTEDFSKNNVQLLDVGLFSKGEIRNINFGFLGITGSMKTSEAFRLAENFVFRLGYAMFWLDVKGESHIHREPLTSLPNEEVIEEIHKMLGQDNLGMDLLIISPRSIITDKNVDKYFSVGWNDIKYIAENDQAEATRLFSEILGISSDDDDAIDLIDRAIEDSKIRSLDDFNDFITEIYEAKDVDFAGSSKILRKLKPRMEKGLLSDDPRYQLDLLEELKSRKGKGGVVFRGKIKVAGLGNYIDLSYEACLKICLSKILYDGLAWNVSKDNKAVLKSDIFVHLGELDTLAPDDDRNQMSLYMRNYATKGRQAGINLSCDVQEVSTCDKEFFAQIRILNLGKVSESNAKALERKGIDKVNIKYLQNLRTEVWPTFEGKKIGYHIPERVVIGRNNEIKIYLASPGQSQFMYKS